ncbi:MAG: hypothetical protein NTX00_01060 [Candidatus Parcubacteria bacterium]|nr:hypothetical protein [Candidatus Parcubacteria bacterium]
MTKRIFTPHQKALDSYSGMQVQSRMYSAFGAGLRSHRNQEAANFYWWSFTIGIVAMTIFWSIGLAVFAPNAQATTFNSGDLIKASTSAVYYYAADAKRYVFPNEKTFKTWYADFSSVKIITDAELAAIQISGNVTYRPGVKMVKITTDPKVYAVAANGILRWVTTESLAASLYGSNWRAMIEDVPDAFFINYNIGLPINNVSDYNPAAATTASVSINADKSLIVPTTGPVLTVSLAPDTPAAGTVPGGTTLNFTKIIFSATSAPINIKSIYVTRYGLSSNNDVNNIQFVNASNATISSSASLGSNSKALITFIPALTVNVNNPLSLYIKASVSAAAPGGSTIALGIAQASDIVLVSGMVGGNLPVIGNYMSGSTIGSNLEALTPPEGILIAGKVKQGVASFKSTAGQAEDMFLDKVIISDTGTGTVAINWYLYADKRNDGIAISQPVASAIMDPTTKKAQLILSGNSVLILASQSVTLTVAVDALPVDGTTVQNGDTLKAVIAAPADIEATGKASGQKTTGSAVIDSKIYNLVASYPYISLDPNSPKTHLVPGTKTLLAVYQVTADSADEVDFFSAANNTSGIANKLKVNIGHSCTAGVGLGMVLQDENGNILDTQAVDVCAANSVTFTFGNPNNLAISAGATKKLYVYADTTGATSAGDSIQVYLSDDNAANLDYAIDGSGNYQFAQFVFRSNIYANVLAR